MKKTMMIFAGIFFILATLTLNAQKPAADYFIGKWNILVEGTPSGDANMILSLEKKDGKVVGILKQEGESGTPIDRVEIKENEMTVYWVASGYDVYLYVEKIDDNKLEGTLMDMFDASAERIKK